MSDSITVREKSQIVPIVSNVVRRHPSLAARGVLVEHHAMEAAEFPERELLQHNFFMYTCSSVRAEIKSPEFSGMRWIRPGALWVMPQGCRHQVRFEGPVEGVALAFDSARDTEGYLPGRKEAQAAQLHSGREAVSSSSHERLFRR